MNNGNNGKPTRILIVAAGGDPDSDLLDSLEGLGWMVDRVEDGGGALNACTRNRYDLVIVWLEGRDPSNLYFVQLLKLKKPRLPVLVISQPLAMADLATVFRWGATDCVRPGAAGHLPEEIQKYLSHHRS